MNDEAMTRAGDTGPRRLLAAGLLLAVVGLAGVVVALARLTIDPTVSEAAGEANLLRLWPLWITSSVGWAGLTAVWIALARRPGGPGPTPVNIAVLLVVAVAARVVVLAGHEPALSDDVYRYVFDGRNMASGLNPYLIRPSAAADAPTEAWPGQREIAARVNNPQLHTIYLPMSQGVFGAAGAVLPDSITVAGEVRVFRAVLTLLEMVAVGLVLRVLIRNGRSPWWAALYAWHPLPLTEIAGSGHQESIGLVLLMLAMTVWTAAPRRVSAWTVPLAAAAMVKPVVIPVAPLLLRGRPWRAWAASAGLGAVVCVLLAAPLLNGTALQHLRETSSRFSLKWAHFGSVYEPVLRGIERLTPAWGNDPQEQLARVLCVGLLGAVIIVVWIRARDAWRGAATIFLAMVLLSPSAHPWYLLWALILLPMAPGPTLWIASLTISWGYVAWRFAHSADGGVGWGVGPRVMVLAYAPVYLAAILSLMKRLRP